MEITKEDIRHVAGLARLDISKDSQDRFISDMRNIIQYFDKLNELDIVGLNDDIRENEEKTVLREDFIKKSYDRQDIIMNAPDHDEIYIIVPSVVE